MKKCFIFINIILSMIFISSCTFIDKSTYEKVCVAQVIAEGFSATSTRGEVDCTVLTPNGDTINNVSINEKIVLNKQIPFYVDLYRNKAIGTYEARENIEGEPLLTDFEKEEVIKNKNVIFSKSQEITTGKKTFDKIVSFVNKKGFIITEKGIPSDRQYTFIDSKGNRHAIITTKRDTEGNPSTKAEVESIIVYGYKKGIIDSEHYFGYCINAEKVYPSTLQFDGTWNGAEEVTLGYNEFLKIIK